MSIRLRISFAEFVLRYAALIASHACSGRGFSGEGLNLVSRFAFIRDSVYLPLASETEYLTDAGTTIWHRRDAGAVELAKRLLEEIKNGG
jgi:hypothetical protein